MTTITGNARFREAVAARLVRALRPDGTIVDSALPDAGSTPNPGDYAIEVDTHEVLLQAHAFDPQKLTGPWRAETVYAVGDVIFETGPDSNSLVLECTAVTGTEESGASEPNWDSEVSAETTDADVTWETLGTIAELAPLTQYLYQPVLLTSVSPSIGSVDGGETITVTGQGFVAGSTTVEIGGASASNVVVSSDTELTCETPSGSSGDADVTVSVDGVSASLPDSFEYVEGGTWTPAELTDLLAWYHTRDSANYTLDGSGNGTHWEDLSGNDWHGDATGTESPPLVANAIDSFPAFDFQTGSHYFNLSLSDSHGEYVIFAVLDPDRTDGYREYVFTAESPLFAVAHNAGSDSVSSYDGGFQNYGAPETGVQSLLWNLVEGSGAAEAFRNGGSIGTATWSSHSISGTQVSIGNRPGQNQELNGRIGELLIVRAPLSQDDIDKIVGYAHHAWNRADLLPAGHPYKNVAP